MQNKHFLHQHSNFKEIVGIVAKAKTIDPYTVEKDYWVMHCLFGLQQSGNDFH